jgi:hypothetical protein
VYQNAIHIGEPAIDAGKICLAPRIAHRPILLIPTRAPAVFRRGYAPLGPQGAAEFGAAGLIPDRRIRGTVATSVDSGVRMVATCRRPRCSPGTGVGEAVKAPGPSLTACGIVLALVGVVAWTGRSPGWEISPVIF